MQQNPYPYTSIREGDYRFTSDGASKIRKRVSFTPLPLGSFVNLAFGDSRPDGSIDDRAISNNGDIKKVIHTVIDIIKEYTELNPEVTVYFRGSTPERTKLYRRIVKMYHNEFSKEFTITGFIKTKTHLKTDLYDPEKSDEYYAFEVQRIS